MINLLKDLLSTFHNNKNGETECFFDNNMNCITHGWYNSQIVCPHKRAKDLLIASCNICDEEGMTDNDIGNIAVYRLCDHEE